MKERSPDSSERVEYGDGQALKNIAKFFDERAEVYDRNMEQRGWPCRRVLGEILRSDHSFTPASALDLGSGTGSTIEEMLITPNFNIERAVAVDLSARMLDKLHERVADDRIETVIAPIDMYLAESAENFDLITAMAVVPFLPEAAPTFHRIADRLNSGGKFIFTYDPLIEDSAQAERHKQTQNGYPVHRYLPEEIHEIIHTSGLHMVEERALLAAPNTESDMIIHVAVAERLR